MSIKFSGNTFFYLSKVSEETIKKIAGSIVSHEINDYTSLERCLEEFLFQLDPSSEISPTVQDMELNNQRTWQGSITVYTRIDSKTIEYAIRAILENGKLINNSIDQNSGYQLKLLHSQSKIDGKELSFKLFLPNEKKLFTLPLNLGTNSVRPLSLTETPEKTSQFFDFALKATQIESLQTKTENYLKSIGQYSQELTDTINRADWHSILRSLAPVTAAAGFAACGFGGVIGVIFQGIATVTGTTSVVIKASDFAESEQAQELFLLIKDIIMSQTKCSTSASSSNQFEITNDEDGWALVSKK